MCTETANYMIWHANGREDDGLLQHPVDGEAWKNFDKFYPIFAEDPCNVRLALATDSFNPYNSMSIVHSTWPVILVNYNLPPWLATKSEFLILSLLIPDPLSPGNDIDVYFQPLIKHLNDLWEFGLETYNASTNTRFDMHVARCLLLVIFQLTQWYLVGVQKGKHLALIVIMKLIRCGWHIAASIATCVIANFWILITRGVIIKETLMGRIEERNAPLPLTGIEIEELLCDFPNDYGKKQPKMRQEVDDPNPWRKLSIFHKLPY